MKKTVLITGTSSGIGLAAAKYFADEGWNVAATMRTPEKDMELKDKENVKVYRLDVTDEKSIKDAIEQALKDFGALDVIINNAGYGAVGAFEAASPEKIRKEFETNVFGLMNVTRAILPYFREKKSGTIINVSSIGGRLTFPIYSIYHASKWAVEGFTEALQFELRPFNIRVKLVEPGPIKTDFYDRSLDLFEKEGLHAYDDYVKRLNDFYKKGGESAVPPEVVAKTLFKAASDNRNKLRYPSSAFAHVALFFRRILPYRVFDFFWRKGIEFQA